MEFDAHVMIECCFGFEGRDAKIGIGFVGCLEKFVQLAIGLVSVNKSAQFDLQGFKIGGLFRLGYELGYE